jgi:hypothetical protein
MKFNLREHIMDKQYVIINVSEGIRSATIVQDEDGNVLVFDVYSEASEFLEENIDDGIIVEYS